MLDEQQIFVLDMVVEQVLILIFIFASVESG